MYPLMRTRAWIGAVSTSVAALTAAVACHAPTEPSGLPGLPPTAISVEPSQLQLGVGDTGQVRVVLLAGTQIVGVERDGWYNREGTSSASRMVNDVRTSDMETITFVGVTPGTDTWTFHYMKKTTCTDPPMCYLSHWYDYIPPQMLAVVVR